MFSNCLPAVGIVGRPLLVLLLAEVAVVLEVVIVVGVAVVAGLMADPIGMLLAKEPLAPSKREATATELGKMDNTFKDHRIRK